MKPKDLKQWSNGRLMRLAFYVGQEIDRRWKDHSLKERKKFQDCSDVFSYFHYRLWTKSQEIAYGLYLNQKSELLGERLVTLGTVNANLIHAREVFASAIELRASAVLIVHNHPSGNAMPSLEDIAVTKRLKKVGKLIGIELLDHVIIGKNQYYSHSLKKVLCV